MTVSIDSESRQLIACCHNAGTIDDPVDGRLGSTTDDPSHGRRQDNRLLGVIPQALSMTPSMDANTRQVIAWCHTAGTIDDPIDGRRHKAIECLVSYHRHYR